MIKINVSGEIISTTRDILVRVSDSKLASMINGDCEAIPALDADGNIFLDYQPSLFRYLLDQLRLIKMSDRQPLISPPQSRILAIPFKQMIEDLNFRLAPSDKDDIITLNVGGEIFATRREVLTRVPNSQLATVISSYEWRNIDGNGYIFLDFDPKLFRCLLAQLRISTSCQRTCTFRPPSSDDTDAFNYMLIQLGLYNITTTTTSPTSNLISRHAKLTASNFCNSQRTSCSPSAAVAEKINDILDPQRPVDNYWNSGGYAPQYLQLELPRAQTISRVLLQINQTPNGQTSHSLLVGSEQNALREVKVLIGYTIKHEWINMTFSPPLENVRFLRVNTIASPSWIAWAKFLVLGY